MITIDTDTTDVDDVAAELRAGAVDDAIALEADAAIAGAARSAERGIRQAAARHRKTGRLDAAIRATVSGTGIGTTARITTGPIAPILVAGQRPHEIRPIAGRVLAFAGPVQGFAAHVNHPGVAPDPFVARGMAAAAGELAAQADDAAADIAAAVAAKLEG